MYAWENAGEQAKETEEDKLLRLTSRQSMTTINDSGLFNPSAESEGWYVKSQAEPCPHWVDFRVVMSEKNFQEFQIRHRRAKDSERHTKRFSKGKDKENKQDLPYSRLPYVDKGSVEKSLYREGW